MEASLGDLVDTFIRKFTEINETAERAVAVIGVSCKLDTYTSEKHEDYLKGLNLIRPLLEDIVRLAPVVERSISNLEALDEMIKTVESHGLNDEDEEDKIRCKTPIAKRQVNTKRSTSKSWLSKIISRR